MTSRACGVFARSGALLLLMQPSIARSARGTKVFACNAANAAFFTCAGVAATVVEDLVSRNWLA